MFGLDVSVGFIRKKIFTELSLSEQWQTGCNCVCLCLESTESCCHLRQNCRFSIQACVAVGRVHSAAPMM